MTVPLTRSDRTKAALRAAATDCFRERGFQSATTAEIARRAGVAEGTVFLHYTNKLGLLTAITRDFYDALQADGERVISDPEIGDADRLRLLIASWTSQMADQWDFIQVFLQMSQSQPDTELAQTVHQRSRRYTRLCTGLIDKLKVDGALPVDVPTGLLRGMVFGTLEHTARGQQYAGKPIDTDVVGQQILDLLLRSGRSPDGGDTRLAVIEGKLDRLLERLPARGQKC